MTTEDKKKEDEVEDIEIVEEGQGGAASGADKADEKDKGDDERLRSTDDADDEEEIGTVEGETPEDKAQRRREERRKRKERQKRAEHSTKEELRELREANQQLTKNFKMLEAHALNNEAKSVDNRMANAQRAYEIAEARYAEAVAKGDGIGSAKQLRMKEEASADFHDAQQMKARLSEIVERTTGRTKANSE